MKHTRLPKEDHLPDWARRDNQVKKGYRVEYIHTYIYIEAENFLYICLLGLLASVTDGRRPCFVG